MSKQHLQLNKAQKSTKSIVEGYRLNVVWFVAVATFIFSSFFFGFFSGGRALTER